MRRHMASAPTSLANRRPDCRHVPSGGDFPEGCGAGRAKLLLSHIPSSRTLSFHGIAANFNTTGHAPSGTSRRGLSLLEVLVSVAIFLGALTAILFALGIGQRSELSARLQSEAVLRCEAVMAEFISGVREADASDGNPFDDDDTGNWTWTAQVESGPGADLLQVTVLVEHRPGGSEPNAAFSLVRYMRDPQLFLDSAIEGPAQ